jgi:hypothetical protein
MIERIVYDTLNSLVNEFPIIAITVPRQSCKKTIAMKAFPNKSYLSKNIFSCVSWFKSRGDRRSPLLTVTIDQRLSNNEFTRLS